MYKSLEEIVNVAEKEHRNFGRLCSLMILRREEYLY